MYPHILISTDGSETAAKGLDHGLSLARALGARVTVVTVTEPFPAYSGGAMAGWPSVPVASDEYNKSHDAYAQTILDAAKATAAAAGVTIETLHVPNSYPAEAIVRTAEEKDCSLIVMASHGRRGLGRLILGSQAAEVLSHSSIPVLVVK